MKSKKVSLEREIAKGQRYRLASIDTRATFLLVHPEIQGTSKTFLTVATVTFAGSLTFLGLKDVVVAASYLKWAWAVLAFSVLIHLFLHLAVLDGLISHGRVETNGELAKEELLSGKLTEGYFKYAFASHYNQGVFHRSTRYALFFLILQALSVMAGGVLMGIFVWQNL